MYAAPQVMGTDRGITTGLRRAEIELAHELAESLDRLATEHGTTRADLIRMAIQQRSPMSSIGMTITAH